MITRTLLRMSMRIVGAIAYAWLETARVLEFATSKKAYVTSCESRPPQAVYGLCIWWLRRGELVGTERISGEVVACIIVY